MRDKENIEYKENDSDLDVIFEGVKNNKIRDAVKRAKRFSTIKIILISLVTFAILSIGTLLVGKNISDMRWNEYIMNIDYNYAIQAPNKFPGNFQSYKGYFGGEVEHQTFKYINGKRVYTGTYGTKYNLLGSTTPQGGGAFISNTHMTEEEINYLPRYNYLGQESMEFYYPYVDYGDRYKEDISLLEDIGKDKYIEMALSFDRDYSIDEVKNMIPGNVDLTWYWVDTVEDRYKDEQKQYTYKQELENGETIDVEQYPDICYEDYAYGIKTINEYGEKIENPEESFIQVIKENKEHLYATMAGEDGKLTKDDIKVQGVVVTGDAENLKSLKNLPFIKATSIGVITEKY